MLCSNICVIDISPIEIVMRSASRTLCEAMNEYPVKITNTNIVQQVGNKY